MTNELQVDRFAISPPDVDPAWLDRPDLLDRLGSYLNRRLILVQAPAGYGKTSLLASFAEQVDRPLCWVRLRAADRDPMHLAAVMRESLLRRFRRLRGELNLESMVETPAAGIASAFLLAIRNNIQEKMALVFDDMHLIQQSVGAIEFMDALVSEAPANMTIILASRELPRLSLAPLVMDAEVGGVGARDLALSRGEVAELVRRRQGEVAEPTAVDSLYEDTQGWLTGVLLSSMSGVGGHAIQLAGEPTLDAYLAEAVLTRQPEDLQAFLLGAAVLPRMTAPLCDALLARSDSRDRLAELVHRGLFTSAAQTEPPTYELHPLFRRALLHQLESQDRERLVELQRRAASLLEEHGWWEEAFDLYLDSGQPDDAAQMACGLALELYAHGRTTTLTEWAEQLEARKAEAPELYIFAAKHAHDRGQLEEADAWVSACLANGAENKLEPELLARVKLVQARVALMRGDFDRTLGLAAEAEALLPDDGAPLPRGDALRLRAVAAFRSRDDGSDPVELARRAVRVLMEAGEVYSGAQALLDLGMILGSTGRLAEAGRAHQRAYDLLQDFGAPIPLAIIHNNLAVQAHQNGHYDEAIRLFAEALRLARQSKSYRRQVPILLGQADLYSDLRLLSEAADLYEEALQIGFQISIRDLIIYAYLHTSILHRRAGNIRLAREWLDRAVNAAEEPTLDVEIHRLALDVAANPERAFSGLENLLRSSEARATSSEATYMHFFAARALLAAGKEDLASERLAAAMSFANGHGAEQVLAGELIYDHECLDLATRTLAEDPALTLIRRRMEFMRLVADRYRRPPPDAPTSGLEANALGESSLRLDGERIVDLAPLPRQLLFFLLDRQPVQRDIILEAFWPDSPADKKASSLYSGVYALRNALGLDLVSIQGSLYSIDSNLRVAYDVSRFERSAEVAGSVPPGDPRRRFALSEALSSYTGPFLPEFQQDWVVTRRRALEAVYVDVLIEHAKAAAESGVLDQAVESLRLAIDHEPFRDDLHLQFMRHLAHLGRRSELVSHYHEYTRLLSEELGVDPPAEILDFYQQYMS